MLTPREDGKLHVGICRDLGKVLLVAFGRWNYLADNYELEWLK
jgi:hypothetical protein